MQAKNFLRIWKLLSLNKTTLKSLYVMSLYTLLTLIAHAVSEYIQILLAYSPTSIEIF
jgi:hypothetical protein